MDKEKFLKLIELFSRMDKRLKKLIGILVVSIILVFYYNLIYKNQSRAISAAKNDLVMAKNNLNKITDSFPDINKERQKLSAAKKNLESLKIQLEKIEIQLPTESKIAQFLDKLVSEASGYAIDFTLIKPKPIKGQKEYAGLDIEIKFNSNYADFANYINHLELSSGFLKITNITMENMKGTFSGELDVTLDLSTLLGADIDRNMPQQKEEAKYIAPLNIERSPFVSGAEVFQTDKKEEYKLSGIVASPDNPTAIINNEVYRQGDAIGNKIVDKIFPNMVVLTRGSEKTVLTIEGEK